MAEGDISQKVRLKNIEEIKKKKKKKNSSKVQSCKLKKHW